MFLDRLYIKMSVGICAGGIVFSAAGSEPSGQLLVRLGKEVLNAASAGALDVMISEPCEYFKTMYQVGAKCSWNPRVWYSGAPVSLASTLPTTVIQFASRELLREILPEDGFNADIERSLLGGFASSLTATPAELVKLHVRMQAEGGEKKSAREMAGDLIKAGGWPVLLRGITAKAAREGLFSSGYLTIYPRLVEKLSDVGLEPMPSAVTAACLTCISQPIDTVSTRMQEDYLGKTANTSLGHAAKIYHTQGLKGLYAGFGWRFLSMFIGISCMGNVAMHTKEGESC